MREIIAVSGGFDPLHVGHLRMFEAAAGYGNLVVIVNNDNWLRKKKGFVFMPEQERFEIIRGLACVSFALLTDHPDASSSVFTGDVCKELAMIRPNRFANGGDRQSYNTPETKLCKELGINTMWGVGGFKIQSSSKLVEDARENTDKTLG